MGRIIIAIDGHSSTGKSTAAKQLAEHLDYVYVDTGAMYRAIAFHALSSNLVKNGRLDKQALIAALPGLAISFKLNPDTHKADVYLNGTNIEKEIRTLEVSNIVSPVAEISEVRAKLVEQQQAMGQERGIVMDGRDIGTVVFPNAELKVFMTAAPEVRAKRRYDELVQRGDQVTYEEIHKNVLQRDHIDSTREDSPLIQAKDARLLDTSEMSREEQFELLKKWAMETIEAS
ncbi:cytidylate kinase [Nonlabens sp. MIC269]|uniref:(d)CMP kinase n=1 Tax=Nonlabens sp. MIC269 TaxID=1476901 RepID=UPI00071FB06D|nr:(d)CMP kinase [Nonlabens sp. MIC269]ALM20055.1 cytidylate kinase [Nonlabens sp. MIC269]